jgi:hypothetical protein
MGLSDEGPTMLGFWSSTRVRRHNMRRLWVAVFVGASGLAAGICNPGHVVAQDTVTIESRSVIAGSEDVAIGIYVANSQQIRGISLPLEFRVVTPGSFITDSIGVQREGRLAATSIIQLHLRLYPEPNPDNVCSGPVSRTYTDIAGSFEDFFTSPDAIWWAGLSNSSFGPFLEPGSDGEPGTGIPSLKLTFGVSEVPGSFEIDTCCTTPMNHIGYSSMDFEAIIPRFIKGVITIAPCNCTCHTDPQCDGNPDVFDVVASVNVAFRNVTSIKSTFCPYEQTDADCDGDTDVIDVVKFVNVAFRNADAGVEFCEGCG